jgi:RsiW-degrading membrane proteinase PrsW (M82 family)
MMNLTSTTFIYGALAGILPSLLWLWFWLKEDNLHNESRSTLAGCFIVGMLAVCFALPLEWLTQQLFPDAFHQYVIWAGIEEVVKFAAAYIVVFHWRKMHEPVDAMIYMITAALGFAAIENTLFLFGVIDTGNIVSTIVTGNMRFIGATLVHIVASATIGFMIAVAFHHGRIVRFIAAAVGLALAISLHAAFNLAIINGTSIDALKIFAWVWAGIIVLILLFEEVKGMEIKYQDAANKKT